MLETPVLLLENFDEESQMLYQSFRTSGFDGPVLTFSDEGFLPDDVTSIYTYYCDKKEGGKAQCHLVKNISSFKKSINYAPLF